MRKTVNKRRTNITLVILFTLLFNSFGSLYVSASMLNHAKTFADEDRVLICTGNTYKWISLSAYESSGKVEFIDPPQNTPQNLEEITCSYGYISDSHFSDLVVYSFKHLAVPINKSQNITYFEALFSSAKHQLPLSRGPPIYL